MKRSRDRWAPERVFINPVTNTTYEYVFPFEGENELIIPFDREGGYPPASFAVHHEHQAALIKAASAVGRLFCLFTPTPRKTEWLDYVVSAGTAFYVAPDVLCTAQHHLDGPRLHFVLRGVFFTPNSYMTNGMFENHLVRSGYKLDGQHSSGFWSELAARGVWQANVKPFFLEHWQKQPDVAPLPEGGGEKQWELNDFAFLSMQRESPVWFLPSTTAPTEHDLITLIAYAASADEFYYKHTYGPYAIPDYFALFGIFHGFCKKFLSPGTIAAERNAFFGTHMANAEMSSSGGPIVPLKDLREPFTFLGVHVGSLPAEERNYMLHTHHKVFCQEYAFHVLPSIRKLFQDRPHELSQEKRNQLKEYLKVVEASYPSGYDKDDRRLVQTTLSEI